MIKRLFKKVVVKFNEKDYKGLGLYATTLVFFVMVSIMMLILILDFIQHYFGAIVLLGTVLCTFISWIRDKHKKELELLAQEEEQRIVSLQSMEKAQAENNYYYVHKAVFTVLNEISSSIKLTKPITMGQIESPSRYFARDNFTIYQFLCMKNGDTDIVIIHEMLQQRINQKLRVSELEIPNSTYQYEGRIYPSLYVDQVEDMNTYVQINVVLVNEAYCRYLLAKKYAKNQSFVSKSTDIKDKDF